METKRQENAYAHLCQGSETNKNHSSRYFLANIFLFNVKGSNAPILSLAEFRILPPLVTRTHVSKKVNLGQRLWW